MTYKQQAGDAKPDLQHSSKSTPTDQGLSSESKQNVRGGRRRSRGRGKQPGDNPNKLNMMGSKVRPQTQNSAPEERVKQQGTIRWADPIKGEYPINQELRSEQKRNPAAFIELDNELPYRMAQSYATLYESIGAKFYRQNDLIDAGKHALFSLAFFGAAKQLYAAMDQYEQARCHTLRLVFQDKTKVPAHLSAFIGMIGDFDSRIGYVKVDNSVVLFHRWIAAGIIESTFVNTGQLTKDDALQFVWNDISSKKYLNKLIVQYINSNLSTYDIGEISATTPVFNLDNPQRWADRVSEAEPNRANFRSLVRIYLQTEADWILKQNPMAADPAHPTELEANTLADTLALLNVQLAPDIMQPMVMRENFNVIRERYNNVVKTDLEQAFNMAEVGASNNGFPAQIVSSDAQRLTATFMLPLSDSDIGLGYMLNPCKNFLLSPTFEAGAYFRPNVHLSDVCSKDVKTS